MNITKYPLLKNDSKFTPCLADIGDELYRNGIFEFNITKMLNFIEHNKGNFKRQPFAVKDSPASFSSIKKTHVASVDVSKPIILIELSPTRYTVIDGHHRLEKARTEGLASIMAYRLTVKQFLPFMTSLKAYSEYIKYWNSKVRGINRSAF